MVVNCVHLFVPLPLFAGETTALVDELNLGVIALQFLKLLAALHQGLHEAAVFQFLSRFCLPHLLPVGAIQHSLSPTMLINAWTSPAAHVYLRSGSGQRLPFED